MPHLCSVCQKPSSTRCSRCLDAYYCGKECQKKDWAGHKESCKKAGFVAGSSFYDRHGMRGVQTLGGVTMVREGPMIYTANPYVTEEGAEYVETAFGNVTKYLAEVEMEKNSARRIKQMKGAPDNYLNFAIVSIVVPLGKKWIADQLEARFKAANIKCVNYYDMECGKHTLSSAELLYAKVAIVNVVSNDVAGRFDGFRNNAMMIMDSVSFSNDIKERDSKPKEVNYNWGKIMWQMDAPDIPLWYYTHSVYEGQEK